MAGLLLISFRVSDVAFIAEMKKIHNLRVKDLNLYCGAPPVHFVHLPKKIASQLWIP